jgi:hypothetical protein
MNLGNPMKHIVTGTIALLLLLASSPSFACKQGLPERFVVLQPEDRSSEHEAPPVPDIRVASVNRATGTDEASCESSATIVLEVGNPGDYGLVFELLNGETPFRFPDEPLLAKEQIYLSWEDGNTRRDDVDFAVAVTPISKDGVMGETAEIVVEDNGRACSAAGTGGLSIWALGLALVALRRRFRRRG